MTYERLLELLRARSHDRINDKDLLRLRLCDFGDWPPIPSRSRKEATDGPQKKVS